MHHTLLWAYHFIQPMSSECSDITCPWIPCQSRTGHVTTEDCLWTNAGSVAWKQGWAPSPRVEHNWTNCQGEPLPLFMDCKSRKEWDSFTSLHLSQLNPNNFGNFCLSIVLRILFEFLSLTFLNQAAFPWIPCGNEWQKQGQLSYEEKQGSCLRL